MGDTTIKLTQEPLRAVLSAHAFWFLATFVLTTSAFSQPSFAHGRMFGDPEQCRVSVGPDTMSFSAYQPGLSRREFCRDIPDVGRTIFVLDGEQPDLRELPVTIRIVKNVGITTETDGSSDLTVAYREPRRYPHGSITLEHTFSEPGYYAGLVTVQGRNGEQWETRVPFSVGKTLIQEAPYYLVLAAAAIAGPLACVSLFRSSR